MFTVVKIFLNGGGRSAHKSAIQTVAHAHSLLKPAESFMFSYFNGICTFFLNNAQKKGDASDSQELNKYCILQITVRPKQHPGDWKISGYLKPLRHGFGSDISVCFACE
ncbi:hypothetical protein GOODEAATRI_030864 [Goodea atripinnis]|uniref:Uncharacterized protein n=1 Tax=Goodea atripinnis TaxID=208336 RepID=A0ABV0MM46_9TELE